MRIAGSNNLLLALFALLAMGSVGLKAAAGPPKDGLSNARPGQVERQLADTLVSQGFTTMVKPKVARSAVVVAERGGCRLSARDARGGSAFSAVFARDAKTIGGVRYLFRGHSYASPPTMAMRLGRLEAEARSRFGLGVQAPILVALAKSGGCGPGTFGLEDVRIAA